MKNQLLVMMKMKRDKTVKLLEDLAASYIEPHKPIKRNSRTV